MVSLAEDTGSQSEINDDHLYRDPDYSWDEFIQSQRIVKKRLAGEACLNCAQKCPFDGGLDQKVG